MKAITKKYKAKKDINGDDHLITIPKEVIGSFDRVFGNNYELEPLNITLKSDSLSFEVHLIDDLGNNVSNNHTFTYDEIAVFSKKDIQKVMADVLAIIDELLPEVDYLKDKIEEKI